MSAAPSDIWRALERTAEAVPDEVAVRHASRALTFRELRAEAERVAAGLASVGVRAGDLVAVSSADPIAFSSFVLASLRSSAAALLLAPGQGAQAVRSAFEDVRIEWAVTDDHEAAGRLAAAGGADDVRSAGLVHAGCAPRASRAAAAPGRCGDRQAQLGIDGATEGDRGRCDGGARRGGGCLVDARARRDARCLCPVPLHHSYGFDLRNACR